MFNVVPQWNPLRLAEDFATMHNLSGGRGILGVGRGTVPREVLHLNDKGVSIGSHDNPDQAAADTLNREVFEESMEIVRRSLANERFSFQGEHFQIPVPGIPDRGSTVQEMTLIPRPALPVRDLAGGHQSADTRLRARRRPRRRVLEPALLVHQALLGHLRRALRGGPRHDARAHENRMLVVAVRIEDTYEEAIATATPGHDEFWKFLGPYGWSRGYMGDDGKPAKPGLIPSLDESLENKTILLGTAEQVARACSSTRTCSACRTSRSSRTCSATSYKKADEQMARFMDDVMPLVS